MTQATRGGLSVLKVVTVDVPQDHAFLVFTEQLSTWWPLASHHIGKSAPVVEAVMEPRAGGRWFERAADGAECNWGEVLVWDPPQRVILAWRINAEWQYDPSIETEVEVRFIAEAPEITRVELEHRGLDRFGDRSAMMRDAFDSEGGWGLLLQRFAAKAGAFL